MSKSGRVSGPARGRVGTELAIGLAIIVGLLAVLRAELEVATTALVLGVAVMVGAGVGAATRPGSHRHGLLLLATMIVPTIALTRWTGPYGIVWLVTLGCGAVTGRAFVRGLPAAEPSVDRQAVDPQVAEAQGQPAVGALRWMLVILTGMLLPLGATLAVGAWAAPMAARAAVVLATLVVVDTPLVVAGVRGAGAVGASSRGVGPPTSAGSSSVRCSSARSSRRGTGDGRPVVPSRWPAAIPPMAAAPRASPRPAGGRVAGPSVQDRGGISPRSSTLARPAAKLAVDEPTAAAAPGRLARLQLAGSSWEGPAGGS